MSRKTLFIPFVLILLAALVACGGGDTPATPEQPTTAVPPTAEVAEATAESSTPAATETQATATAEPTAESSPAPAVLCPDLPRPALLVGNGPAFEAVDVASGARCPLALPEMAAYPQAAANAVYFLLSDQNAGNSAVHRLAGSGAAAPLEATRVTNDVHYLLRFAASGDGSRLAWSHMRPQDDPNAASLLGSLWIGDADGGNLITIMADEPGREMRIVSPIRFSAEGQTLFFSWEPIGLGGAWSSFNGRYDNLYRVPATGGEPVKVYDCADAGLFLCLGDFRDDGTLATIDTEQTIHVVGPDGGELAAIPTAGDYAGYPTFSPTGDLYYSVADLDENSESLPLPEPGTIYRVAAPYTGEPQVVASGAGLLLSAMRDVFLDGERVAVSASEGDQWGMGLLDATGAVTRLEPWPNAYLAAIWR
jgi:hypothetical protein